MKISIIGSGSWGTALANVAADNFHDVLIYGREQDIVNEINNNHTNNYYLPNALINTKVVATTNLKSAVEDKDIIVLAVPSGAIESVCKLIDPLINKKSIIVNVAKGFNSNNERLSNTIRGSISCEKREEIVSLIGPSHAEEVIQRLYTAISAVSIDVKVAKIVQKAFSNDYLRVYTLHDEIGAEYACACKNVIAIASGIISGLGFGDNTLAALITRGLAEISRLGIIMGGEMETYLGLTGVGDLVVTCTSIHSRNFQAGLKIGKDDGVEDFFKNNKATVEGIRSCKVVHQLAKEKNVEMPITNAVYKVLYENKKPSNIIKDLMKRDLKSER